MRPCCGETVRVLVRGAAGVAKAVAGIDRAEDATIEKRRGICRECPQARPCPVTKGKMCFCSLCTCSLRLKTVVAGETCPLGKW